MPAAFTEDHSGSSSSGAGGGKSVLICLMRWDLRIHDNPLFH